MRLTSFVDVGSASMSVHPRDLIRWYPVKWDKRTGFGLGFFSDKPYRPPQLTAV